MRDCFGVCCYAIVFTDPQLMSAAVHFRPSPGNAKENALTVPASGAQRRGSEHCVSQMLLQAKVKSKYPRTWLGRVLA